MSVLMFGLVMAQRSCQESEEACVEYCSGDAKLLKFCIEESWQPGQAYTACEVPKKGMK